MKLFNKILLLFAVSCTMLVACNDEEDFTPGDPDLEGCFDVYFPQDQEVDLTFAPEAPTELTIVVKRGNTLGAATVPYDLVDEAGVFSVGDIVFENGADSCSVLVTFDNTEVGVSYSCTIDVTDPMYASVYSSNVTSLTITVVREKWKSIGYATYFDEFFFYNSYEVELLQNESVPTKFRLVDPYVECYLNPDEGYGYTIDDINADTYLTFQILSPGNTVAGVTITQNDLVYFEPYYTDYYYNSYSSYVWLYHPSLIASLATEANWTHNRVLSYQDDGLPAVVQLAPAYYLDNRGQYFNYTQDDETVTITFPGVVFGDYSLDISTVVDGLNVTATVTLGEDVEYARVALVEGGDGDAAVMAIENGTVEYEEIYESGEVKLTSKSGGNYTVAAVTFSGGKAQESACTTVRLVDPDETWSVYGAGIYMFSIYWSDTVSGLTLYQSGSDAERFKISNWRDENDLVFYWDQNTNEVEVENQSADTSRSRYDETVYVDGLSDYFGYGTSTYNDGTFYFALVYYTSEGRIAFGSETFIITRTGGDPFPLSSFLGTYHAYGVSYYGSRYDEYQKWVFEESDDLSKGNFMMTTYNGWSCATPIYGTLDTATGSMSIYSGKTGQRFYENYWNVYDVYFASYLAIRTSDDDQQPDSAEFSLLPNGSFIGPLNGDAIMELLYIDDQIDDCNQAFVYVAGTKDATTTTSLSVSDKSQTMAKDQSATDKVGQTPRGQTKSVSTAVVKDIKVK